MFLTAISLVFWFVELFSFLWWITSFSPGSTDGNGVADIVACGIEGGEVAFFISVLWQVFKAFSLPNSSITCWMIFY